MVRSLWYDPFCLLDLSAPENLILALIELQTGEFANLSLAFALSKRFNN